MQSPPPHPPQPVGVGKASTAGAQSQSLQWRSPDGKSGGNFQVELQPGGTKDLQQQVGISKKGSLMKRPIWTMLLVISWITTLIMVILMHAAIGKLAPAFEDLIPNFLTGFNTTLKFGTLVKNGQLIQAQSKLGMETCVTENSFEPSLCHDNVPNFQPVDKQSNTDDMYNAINGAFSATLDVVLLVTEDRCLGVAEFNETSRQIKKVKQDLEQVELGGQLCVVSFTLYCGMWHGGKSLADGATVAINAINDMTTSDVVARVQDNTSYVHLLHALPWIFVLSMTFFTLFWYTSGGVCCCCEGGKCYSCCLCLIPHLLLWLTYLIIAIIVVAIGYAYKAVAADETVGFSPCKVSEFFDHVEERYPEFFNLVLKDLLDGCVGIFNAFQVAVAACIIIGFYALCVCVCRPYRDTDRLLDKE